MGKVKKNIGLVTWFGTPNYGTNLQAYALYRVLEEKGFNVRIIKRFKEPFTLKNIKDNLFYAHGIRRFWKYAPEAFPGKIRKIRRFCRKQMQTATVYTRSDLQRLLERTDLFIAGSDQLWNCYDHFRGFEFLDFAAGKPKVSYATSIGTRGIPQEYQEKVKEYLSDFQHISIREQSGASSISALTERSDIATVLDPVLLQDRAFWDALAVRSQASLPAPGYTLWYILKRTEREALPAIDGRNVIIPSGENPDFTLPDATLIPDAGLEDFVALIRNAGTVVTDSFHGTALSIEFSRPFISLKRFSDTAEASQNIRISDLLHRIGIETDAEGNVTEQIDYQKIQDRLSELRKESNDYLDQALSL